MCLQRFDKFWIWSASYDRKWNLCEKLVKSLQMNLFLAYFDSLKPMCGATPIDLPRPLFELLWATVCPDLTKYFKKERRKIIAKSYLVRVIYNPVFFSSKTQKNQILLVQYYIAHRAGEERYYVHFNTHRHFVIHFHVCRFDKSPAHEVLK